MKVLVINCGSSSIKYNLFSMKNESLLAKGLVEKIGEESSGFKQAAGGDETELAAPVADHEEGLKLIADNLVGSVIESAAEIEAVGHRVVHGGEAFKESTLIDDEVLATIEEFVPLAPLHNPPNLTGIRAAMHLFQGVPQAAVFDTSFHESMPPKAFMYGLPYEFYEKHKVRKYGFHGTSHRFVSMRAAEMLGVPYDEFDCITCHLGNGASLAAVKNGKCVDTSMGLTPLEGVMMGTRTGDMDPAIIFYLNRVANLSNDEMNAIFNKKSGLLGVSGVSNDLREVQAAMENGNKRAGLAIEVFCYRVRKYIGAYMAALGGCNAIVFTGGIGENACMVRGLVAGGMAKLGATLDEGANSECIGREAVISTDESKVRIMVVPTNEELVIARDTYALVK